MFPEPHPGVLTAPGEGGPEKAFPWKIKADSGTMGLARNGEGIYWDPKGQQKSLEGISLDVEKKGSGTHRYPGQRLPGKVGNEFADPGKNKGSE